MLCLRSKVWRSLSVSHRSPSTITKASRSTTTRCNDSQSSHITGITRAKTPSRIKPEAHQAPEAATAKFAYPESLKIYDIGRRRMKQLTFWRMSSLGLFVGAAAFGAFGDAYTLVAGSLNVSVATTMILVSVPAALPMFLLAQAYGPYVASIWIRVPQNARVSREALLHWAGKLHPDTRLSLQTAQSSGLGQTTATTLADLRAANLYVAGVQVGNLKRVQRDQEGRVLEYRPGALRFWKRQVRTRFRIETTDDSMSTRSAAPGVWPLVWRQIQSQSVEDFGRSSTAPPRKYPRLPSLASRKTTGQTR